MRVGTFVGIVMGLVAFVGAVGCSTTSGTTMGDGAAGSTGAAGTAGPAGTAGLIGLWTYSAGTTTRTCPGEAGTDAPPEGDLSIAAGASTGELVVTEPGACVLRFSLAGSTATAAAGQTCAGPDGAGGLITFTKLAWTLTLSADGQTLAEALAADETLAPAQSAARTCRYTETGVTLRRK
jgi:hypothetical protein